MQLALELKDLRQVDVPRPHHHLPRPIPFRRRLQALASRDPRVEEERGRPGADEDGQWNVVACTQVGAEAPRVEREARLRDQARDQQCLVGEASGSQLRTEVRPAQGNRGRRRQWCGWPEWKRADYDTLDAVRSVGAGRARGLTEPPVDVLFAAQRLRVPDGQEVEVLAGHGGYGLADDIRCALRK